MVTVAAAVTWITRSNDDDGVAWAHLDIAGMAWLDKAPATYDKGATGYGVRLLDQYIANTVEG